jgi:hypothetical protein
MPLTLEQKINFCHTMYDFKDELIQNRQQKINTDGSITVDLDDDNHCTVYSDKIVFEFNHSTEDGEDDEWGRRDNNWEATVTKDTINIKHDEYWEDIYHSQSKDSSLSITADNGVTGVFSKSGLGGEAPRALNGAEQNALFDDFILKLDSVIPMQALINASLEKRANVHAFFQTATKMPSPIIEIIKGYVI